MSHDATAWARKQQVGSSPAKFVLLILADFAGTDYSCWPSVAKLAEVTELSESTVRNATKTLAEKGLIRVFYRYRDNHTRRSSRYQLLIDGPDTEQPDTVDWSALRQVPTSDDRQETAEGHRQETAGTPQELADSHRQELALIPTPEPSLREPSVVKGGAARSPRATRLPDGFMPDEKMRAWFAAENLAAAIADPRTEHEKFCDYFRAAPGVKGSKVDWPATWRNWMRTAAERAPRRPGTGLAPTSGAPYRPSTTDQRVAQGLSVAAQFREEESK